MTTQRILILFSATLLPLVSAHGNLFPHDVPSFMYSAFVPHPFLSPAGNLLCPLPRQYRDTKPAGWSHWQGIVTPGSGDYAPGFANAANLNSNIPGGLLGAAVGGQPGSHGLCGDIGSRSGFASVTSEYGPGPARGTWTSGGVARVRARITAYHAGWFEFRLAVPEADGVISQTLLNEHVLPIAPSTPHYPAVLNYAGMNGLNGNGGCYKCAVSGGHADPTATSPNTVWPHGSCCNGGGACSDPTSNTDRYVVEFAAQPSGLASSGTPDAPVDVASEALEYVIDLQLPAGVECDNCVLQWTYQTANSCDHYPEAFWNCADARARHSNARPARRPTPPRQPATDARLACADRDQAGRLRRRDWLRRA